MLLSSEDQLAANKQEEKLKILHVDDNEDFLKVFILIFRKYLDITSLDNGEDALQLFENTNFDAVVLDFDMPGMNGIEILKRMKGINPDIPILFYTGQGNEEVAREAFLSGASDYFTKETSAFVHKEKFLNSIKIAAEVRKSNEALRKSEEKNRELFNNLRIQKELGVKLSKATGLDEGLKICVETAIQASKMDSGAIYLYDEEEECFNISYYQGVTEDYVQKLMRLEKGDPAIMMVSEGKPFYICHKELPKDLRNKIEHEAIICGGIIPFFHEGKIVGTLNVASHILEEIPENFRDILEGIGSQVGGAIARLKTEEALRENKRFMENIFDAISISIVIFDKNGHFVRGNRAFIELFKYPPTPEYSIFTDPIMKNKGYLDKIQELKLGQKVDIPDIWYNLHELCPELPDRPVLLKGTAIPIMGDKGGLLYIIGIHEDITETHKMQKALKESEEQYRTTIDAMSEWVHVIDRECKIILINKSFVEIMDTLGYKTEMTGMSVFDAFPFLHACVRDEYDLVFNEGITLITEESVIINNTAIYTETRKIPVFENREVIRIATIIRDITERKNMEITLQKRNRELNDFTHRVSHDLKNPLNILRGYITAIKEQPEIFDEFYDRVIVQTDKIGSFIDNLLRLSRAGQIIGEKTRIDLNNLLKNIYSFVDDKNQHIKMTLQSHLPVIIGDQKSIEEVFNNLISNSLKYRDHSKENLIIEVTGEITNSTVRISFKDNGSGINPRQTDKIFEPGYTINKKQGSGFGLSIARKIIEAHEGTLKVESEGENQGTTFIITLPAPVHHSPA